jgi:hypothetical protein
VQEVEPLVAFVGVDDQFVVDRDHLRRAVTMLFWTCGGCVVSRTVIGFSQGGWTHLPPPDIVEAIVDGQ